MRHMSFLPFLTSETWPFSINKSMSVIALITLNEKILTVERGSAVAFRIKQFSNVIEFFWRTSGIFAKPV
jgi:hypothetical protein